jgi:drug/metabolite transporter (DMT)-like permease
MSQRQPDHAVETAMTPRTWAMLFALSLLWGCSFPFIKIALGGFPPLTLVLARVTLAALALAPVLMFAGTGFPRGAPVWRAFVAMAVLNSVIPWSLSFWAQQSLPSALGAILNATTPLFAVLVSHFFLPDERLRANRLAGVIVGFVGVAVLIGPETLLGGGERVVAQLAFLAAALSYAFSGVVGRRFVRLGITPVQSTFGQMCAASLFMAPLALIVEQPWIMPPPNTTEILAMLGLALMSTAVAFLLFFRILARAGATNVMLVTLLVPVSAILIAGVFLDERLEPRNFLGMGFIALGLGLIDGRPVQWVRTRLSRAPA